MLAERRKITRGVKVCKLQGHEASEKEFKEHVKATHTGEASNKASSTDKLEV